MFRWDTGGGCLAIICSIVVGLIIVSWVGSCVIALFNGGACS